jgi:hypothetical protein
MTNIIDLIHKDTGLPIDYLIKEQEMCKEFDTRVDCIHFVHWDLHTVAYSLCKHYGSYLINIKCSKDCEFYKTIDIITY